MVSSFIQLEWHQAGRGSRFVSGSIVPECMSANRTVNDITAVFMRLKQHGSGRHAHPFKTGVIGSSNEKYT